MNRYLSAFGRLEAKHYGLIILLQFFIIAALFAAILSKTDTQIKTEASESSIPESVELDIRTCLLLPQDERADCAKFVGKKISQQISDSKDRLRACLGFRPYSYVYDCQKSLTEAQ